MTSCRILVIIYPGSALVFARLWVASLGIGSNKSKPVLKYVMVTQVKYMVKSPSPVLPEGID